MDDDEEMRFVLPLEDEALSDFRIGSGLNDARPAAAAAPAVPRGGGLPFGMAALLPRKTRAPAPARPSEKKEGKPASSGKDADQIVSGTASSQLPFQQLGFGLGSCNMVVPRVRGFESQVHCRQPS